MVYFKPTYCLLIRAEQKFHVKWWINFHWISSNLLVRYLIEWNIDRMPALNDLILSKDLEIQKQSPRGVLWKMCFWKFRKIHSKTPWQSLFFNKVAGLRRVVTPSSYGNALHFGLSMFAEFEKLPYPSATSISARFSKSFHLLLWNLLNI